MKALLACMCFLGLAACGGGGGGDSVPDYTGVWKGTDYIQSNSCSSYTGGHIASIDRVNQNDIEIVVDVDGVRPYSGYVTDDGFSVSRVDTINCLDAENNSISGTTVEATRTIEYFNMDGNTISERFTMSFGQCSNTAYSSNCSIVWAGIRTRTTD